MPIEKCLDILKQGLGTQWHPVVGATFIQLLMEDMASERARGSIINLPNVAA
jgi:hypothetical protein